MEFPLRFQLGRLIAIVYKKCNLTAYDEIPKRSSYLIGASFDGCHCACPLSRLDDIASLEAVRVDHSRASRIEVGHRKPHRGMPAKVRLLSQADDKISGVQESRLETILKTITGVYDPVAH
jgi:hypothetical protein